MRTEILNCRFTLEFHSFSYWQLCVMCSWFVMGFRVCSVMANGSLEMTRVRQFMENKAILFQRGHFYKTNCDFGCYDWTNQ